MLFSSMTFIFLFLPIVCAMYWLTRKEYRNYILLFASILFYAWGEPRYLAIMLTTIVINYFGALLIDKYSKYKKWILAGTILSDLGFLFYFKYFNFVMTNINSAFDGPSIILAYAPCIAHGFALQNGAEHQVNVVNTGAWPLYRFNPANIENGQNPLTLDSHIDMPFPLEEFMKSETRFALARSVNPNFDKLVESAKANNLYKTELKQHIANFTVKKNKDNGEG